MTSTTNGGQEANATAPQAVEDSRWRQLVELAGDWYWATDAQGRYTEFAGKGLPEEGAGITQLIGLTDEDIEARYGARRRLLDPSPDSLRAALAQRSPCHNVNVQWRLADGRERFFRVSLVPRFDRRGAFGGLHGITRDVTQTEHQRRQFDALRQHLQAAMAVSHAMAVEMDFDNNLVRLHRGPSPGEPGQAETASLEQMLEQVHPEDAARLRAVVQEMRAGRIQEIDLEFRLVTPDGQIGWRSLLGRLAVQDWASGQGRRFFGLRADISERKRAEMERLAAGERAKQALRLNQGQLQLRDLDSSDLPQFLRAALETAALTLEVERVGVWLLDEARSALLCQDLYLRSQSQHISGMRIELAAVPKLHAYMAQHKSMQIDDVANDPRLDELARQFARALGVGSTLDCGLRNGAVLDGLLSVRHVGSARTWSAEEVNFCETLAALVTRAYAEQARRKAEHALARSEARFRQLTSLGSDWYWEQDEQFRFTAFFDSLTGKGNLASDKHLGKTRWELPGALATPKQWQEHRAALERHEPFRNFEFRRGIDDGGLRWVSASGDPVFDEQGRFAGYSGIGRDITASRAAQEAIKDARDEAHKASQSKSEFLANMSHEIRSPMNAVLGLTYLALQDANEPRRLDYLGKIHSAAQGLLSIINDILDISKIEAGKLDIESIEFDLYSVLNDVAMMAALRCQDKKIDFELICPADLPVEVLGDPTRLRQVLTNLCSNAIKFTEQGSVRLLVRHTTLADGALELQCAVQDTGIGMDEEQQSKLFQPFTQAQVSTARKYGGTGLGLSISRQLVELMKGRIGSRSVPGQGSEFTCTVMCRQVPEPPPLPSARTAALAGKRLLVLDPDENFVRITRERGQAWGMYVQAASSASQALAALLAARGSGQAFHLVMLDWRLPGIDDLYDTLFADGAEASAGRPKVLVTTDSWDMRLEELAATANIGALLRKPVAPMVLFDTLLKLESLQSARRQRRAAPNLGHARILVVEDDLVNQEVARGILRPTNAYVAVANNGKEAVEMTAPGAFNLVLMDMQMPVMDGIEATRRLRANPALAGLPIIAMTAGAMAGDRERLLAAGMNDYVSKPVNVHALYATLAKWIKEPEPEEPAPPAPP